MLKCLYRVFFVILHQSKHLTGHCYEHSPHMVSHNITTIQSSSSLLSAYAFLYIWLFLLLLSRQKKRKRLQIESYTEWFHGSYECGIARRTILGKAWKYYKKVDPGLITRLFAVDTYVSLRDHDSIFRRNFQPRVHYEATGKGEKGFRCT